MIVEVRISWPYARGAENEDTVEVEIDDEHTGELDDHPDVKEAIDDIVFGRIDIILEVKK